MRTKSISCHLKLILCIFFGLQRSAETAVGTLAYIIDEEALLVRVNKGWQYVAVSEYYIKYVLDFSPKFESHFQSDLVCAQLGSVLDVTTPPPPTTFHPHVRPPALESSNLVNTYYMAADQPAVSTHPKIYGVEKCQCLLELMVILFLCACLH